MGSIHATGRIDFLPSLENSIRKLRQSLRVNLDEGGYAIYAHVNSYVNSTFTSKCTTSIKTRPIANPSWTKVNRHKSITFTCN